jgi:hypothetical protein
MKDKLTILNTSDKDEMLAAISLLKRHLPAIKERAVIMAEIRKASFDAYIDKGFTPEQALQLCISMEL